jgi:hypothetical protein
VAITPMPSGPSSSAVTTRPTPRLNPDAVIAISPNGSVKITNPDGSIQLTTVNDLFPDAPAPGVVGIVVDHAGDRVPAAGLSGVRSSGQPCSLLDIPFFSQADGTFGFDISPGFCLLSATGPSGPGDPVLVEVQAGRTSGVTLIVP